MSKISIMNGQFCSGAGSSIKKFDYLSTLKGTPYAKTKGI